MWINSLVELYSKCYSFCEIWFLRTERKVSPWIDVQIKQMQLALILYIRNFFKVLTRVVLGFRSLYLERCVNGCTVWHVWFVFMWYLRYWRLDLTDACLLIVQASGDLASGPWYESFFLINRKKMKLEFALFCFKYTFGNKKCQYS